jgi:hypothetical protein
MESDESEIRTIGPGSESDFDVTVAAVAALRQIMKESKYNSN